MKKCHFSMSPYNLMEHQQEEMDILDEEEEMVAVTVALLVLKNGSR